MRTQKQRRICFRPLTERTKSGQTGMYFGKCSARHGNHSPHHPHPHPTLANPSPAPRSQTTPTTIPPQLRPSPFPHKDLPFPTASPRQHHSPTASLSAPRACRPVPDTIPPQQTRARHASVEAPFFSELTVHEAVVFAAQLEALPSHPQHHMSLQRQDEASKAATKLFLPAGFGNFM